MPQSMSIASWNSLIAGCFRRKENDKVLYLFSSAIREHRDLGVFAFASALRASGASRKNWHLVQQIHGRLVRHGFCSDPIIGNPLIDLYSKNGNVESGWSVFDELSSRDNVSWVAMVSGFSQNGLGEEALRLYHWMHQSRVSPTPYVLSSVLSACTKVKFFEHGEQVHAQALKQGFCSETFVGNALVTLYSQCGYLNMAEQIFGEMPCRDRVTYNALMSGQVQLGCSESALLTFKEMRLSGFEPDPVTISSLLTACSSTEAIQKGEQLHSFALKAGLSSDYIIEGSILDLYVRCAKVEDAHEFFNMTDKTNVVLWNVMLVAYGQMGNLQKSFDLFYQMHFAGMQPNQYTYPSILRTCTYVGALDLGEQIHTLIIKTGFELNVYVSSVLIDMYSKCGRLTSAREILDRISEDDVVSWTAMIAGYAQNEYFVAALRTFMEMHIHGIQSDNIGLASAVSACAGIKAIEQGLQIHARACTFGYSKDLSIGNSLVNLYAKCGRTMEAFSAFETIELKDAISWNGLISGFAQSGHCEEALKLFVQMGQAGVKANLFTFGSAISASANIADIKQGKQIHAKLIKVGYDSEIEAGNAIVSLYAKCGGINDANMAFSGMSERNEISWNAMITCYSQHGLGRESLKLFEQMKDNGFKPNHVTFLGVLAACSHVGLVADGLDYFKSMSKVHNLVPRPEHYACVVDILGRAGQLGRAKGFIEEMPIDPDAMVWRTLLSACAVHKNMEIGEFAAQHLLKLEPYDSANYVLLSNVYAVTRKWDLRNHVRQMMKDRGVKKEPGRSWIEVKNVVHAFFVGDRLHPLADAIYEFLEDLNKRAILKGYKQDKYYLLNDMEQEQKDHTAYVHSEKLAVAFGLMSLSSEVPLRVIKNLRVCNDCHNWMKFISNVTGRAIILRDAYRFHHFEGGACSCADYW
ncbi:pentatricopeptide repeat-containing protein At4g13650 isoform X1 [Dioscorea cayenensis subsp. rotundata]|uniref:Pentatricopeptide repeat-containing protein At4g13650 isoform X1 n=1 Tax=Dioscorea cayennensis subsp. rotundata TaxID=55577 RepID=A0AB40AWN5_DIOCR|nr:pentatricopeptide repeat-containing protein At4g13650 isoform X1 [Dioscorea cayenensis subsp. rotundata]XP_039119150.1 pentatricopeptide repeat-containing protein At4g13650 isoform X1 [Dioscorea cayenensis subsp. rotundata]XP_039119151.1 pentatricopeptide repeat-containing protein At4g13650 isoform X1 [Dioscorea cayenensis subsp. rotundata]